MKKYTVEDLLNIMERLRSPDGCPWDRVQTHDSIKKSLIEEGYEAIDAYDSGDDKAFANELGDVLMQVVFHAQLAKERNAFDFYDVVNEISNKLVSRHTHVFGKDKAENAEASLEVWEKNKKKEKGLKTYTQMLLDVPRSYPALMRAEKIQKKAASVGFDWDNADGVYEKIEEETNELKYACEKESKERVFEEYGDLLFSVVNLGRALGVEPEMALDKACAKFTDRFSFMENLARSESMDLAELSLEELDKLWEKAKNNNK